MPASDNHTGVKEIQKRIEIDIERIEVVFTACYERLVYVARLKMIDKEAARDVVQELFVDLWNRRDTLAFETDVQVKAYLFRTINSKIANWYRQTKKEEEGIRGFSKNSSDVQQEDQLDLAITEAETTGLIRDAVAKLPPKCRAVMELLLFKGKNPDEISVLLQMKPGTVRENKSQGIFALQKMLIRHAVLLLIIIFWRLI